MCLRCTDSVCKYPVLGIRNRGSFWRHVIGNFIENMRGSRVIFSRISGGALTGISGATYINYDFREAWHGDFLGYVYGDFMGYTIPTTL